MGTTAICPTRTRRGQGPESGASSALPTIIQEDQSTPSFLCLFLSSFLASASLAEVVSMGKVWFGLAPVSTYPCASLM